MQKLIKSIREYLRLSQTEFADKIGVTFATVNRWENGRAIPTKLAQTTLYEYCKEHGIPVYQMILEKIKAEADTVPLEEGRILLYHGSKSGIVGEIAPKSREMCDFGKGFYMGTEPGQPLTLICDFEKSKFYVVSVDIKNLDTIEIKFFNNFDDLKNRSYRLFLRINETDRVKQGEYAYRIAKFYVSDRLEIPEWWSRNDNTAYNPYNIVEEVYLGAYSEKKYQLFLDRLAEDNASLEGDDMVMIKKYA